MTKIINTDIDIEFRYENFDKSEEFKRLILKEYQNNSGDIDRLNHDILDIFENKNKVILVGQVQSGKTAKVIELIKTAINDYKYDLVIYLSGLTKDLNNQAFDRLSSDYIGNVVNISEIKKIKDLSSLVIVTLKEIQNLIKLIKFIEFHKTSFNKILVIDDESDYGSINYGSTSNKDDSEIIKPIYEKIYVDIFNICKKGGVLQLTATPFVNLLTIKDLYSKADPFVFVLPTSNNYTGVLFFNQLNNFWYPIIPNSLKKEAEIDGYKDYLISALFIWVYKSYLLYKDSNIKNKGSDFLINISSENFIHEKIIEILNPWVKMIKDIVDIKKSIKKTLSSFFPGDNITEDMYEEVFNFYRNIMQNDIDFVKLNQESEEKNSDKPYRIYVGGILLSRGRTFENLICEFITIENRFTHDSLLQKCRWFGYRGERSKYMALICNKEIQHQLLKNAEIIQLFHKGNLGYQIDYKTIVRMLRKEEKKFENATLTQKGKIK